MILPLLIGAALAGSHEAAETPKGYMERLYAAYHDPSFNPLDHPGRYFAPKLAAAIEQDARRAKGEVGYLDGDPICQCQDPGGLDARVTGVAKTGRGRAEVRVTIGLAGYDGRPARFSLVQTRNGWRIADVSSPDEPSLLNALEQANRQQREKH